MEEVGERWGQLVFEGYRAAGFQPTSLVRDSLGYRAFATNNLKLHNWEPNKQNQFDILFDILFLCFILKLLLRGCFRAPISPVLLALLWEFWDHESLVVRNKPSGFLC